MLRVSVARSSIRAELLDHLAGRLPASRGSACLRVAVDTVDGAGKTTFADDGLFLRRDELAGRWDSSILLRVPFETSVARVAVRDGSPSDPSHPSLRRCVRGQEIYVESCRPWQRADVVVDNGDLDAPHLVVPGPGRA